MAYSPERLDAPNTHCQCCRRPVQALTGMIGHHGFTERDRVAGVIIAASCPGSRYRPLEVAQDRILNYLDFLNGKIGMIQDLIARIAADEQGITLEYSRIVVEGKGANRKRVKVRDIMPDVTADNIGQYRRQYPAAAIPAWTVAKADYLAQLETKVQELEDELVEAQAAHAAWKPNAVIAKAWSVVFQSNLWNPPLEDDEIDYMSEDTLVDAMGYRHVTQKVAKTNVVALPGRATDWQRTKAVASRRTAVAVAKKTPTKKLTAKSPEFVELMERLGYA